MSKRRHYSKVKRNRMSVKGTQEAMNARSSRPLGVNKRIKSNTLRATRQFIRGRPIIKHGPYLSDRYIPPVMKEELKSMGIYYSVGNDEPFTPTIGMVPHTIHLDELADHGIVVEINRDDREKWRMSGYDLVHILENKMIEDSSINDRNYTAFRKYMESQDPDFIEKYFVYKELKEAGYIVMDATMHGYDFIIYEEPTRELIEELQTIPIARLGAKKNMPSRRNSSYASIAGIGLVTVMTSMNQPSLKELIKGQHLAQKNDLRYFIADADGYHNEDDHLIIPRENSTKIYDVRHNRLNLTTAEGSDVLIGDDN